MAGHRYGEVLKLFLPDLWISFQLQQVKERDQECCSFVSILKGMIGDEAEKQSRRNFEIARPLRNTAERRGLARNGGVQQIDAPWSYAPEPLTFPGEVID